MSDQRLGQAAGEWLREIDSPAPDPDAGVRGAMARIENTTQARRRWPFPAVRRRERSRDAAPTLDGRTRPMFSSIAAITAGALILAAGGAFLVAQDDQPEATVPGAAAPLQEPTAFEGRIRYATTLSEGRETTVRGGVDGASGGMWTYQVITMSDPRLDGDVTLTGNVQHFDDLGADVWSSYVRIETDDGAWQKEPSLVVRFGETSGSASTVLLVGEGAYEGLVAVTELAADLTDPETWAFDIRGIVMDADDVPQTPALPGPAS
jgi:hypothetical protein